mmetsp:Transcript_30494/g.58762  ORF Transcript_30494/g.58762 Transcript_30494/m.58762 type:complete len:138 (-) Transcript_30494:1556-1969(-)
MQVMQNRSSLFSAMHVLLKLCNHPDLLLLRPVDPNKPNGKKCPPPDLEDYGNPERSGKMKVLREILTTWKAQKHKFLVFSQTRQVLDLIEGMIRSQLGINYAFVLHSAYIFVCGYTKKKIMGAGASTEARLSNLASR